MKNNLPIRLLGVRDDFRKVNYEEYKDSCTKELLQQFLDGKLGKDTPIETLRGLMYGYTFTDEYVNGFQDSPFSVRHWEDILYNDDFFEDDDFLEDDDFIEDDDSLEDDDLINTYQYQTEQIIDTILSTGDGKTRETAFCVIDVYQEYELMDEIFFYNMPRITRQSLLADGFDCIEFEPNDFGVEKLYFDVHRRFDVGYPNPPRKDADL